MEPRLTYVDYLLIYDALEKLPESMVVSHNGEESDVKSLKLKIKQMAKGVK